MPKVVIVDIRRCIGCRACQVACKRWNDREGEATSLSFTQGSEWTNPKDLSPQTYTYIRFVEGGMGDSVNWQFVKVQCMHCVKPGCVAVCPTHALQKTPEGPVLWDDDKCIGCKYCLQGCPFNVPRFDGEKQLIEKCTMCADRLGEGLEPACVAACPTDTLSLYERSDALSNVELAVKSGAHVYGREEVGGTSWIYLSNVPLTELGFPKHSSDDPTAFATSLLTQFTGVGLLGALALSGLTFYSKRRSEVSRMKERSTTQALEDREKSRATGGAQTENSAGEKEGG